MNFVEFIVVLVIVAFLAAICLAFRHVGMSLPASLVWGFPTGFALLFGIFTLVRVACEAIERRR